MSEADEQAEVPRWDDLDPITQARLSDVFRQAEVLAAETGMEFSDATMAVSRAMHEAEKAGANPHDEEVVTGRFPIPLDLLRVETGSDSPYFPWDSLKYFVDRGIADLESAGGYLKAVTSVRVERTDMTLDVVLEGVGKYPPKPEGSDRG